MFLLSKLFHKVYVTGIFGLEITRTKASRQKIIRWKALSVPAVDGKPLYKSRAFTIHWKINTVFYNPVSQEQFQMFFHTEFNVKHFKTQCFTLSFKTVFSILYFWKLDVVIVSWNILQV